MDGPTQLIDRVALTPIVRRALGYDTVEIVDWQCLPVSYAKGWQTSGGVYRFSGTASAADVTKPWSAILKIALAPTPSPLLSFLSGDLEPGTPNYWKREMELFRDGVLDWQDGSFVPPRCYGVAEPDESTAWIWLEDVADCFAGNWPFEHYAVAARHLGQFNGRFLVGAALPEHPSFCPSWLRVDRARSLERGESFPPHETWETPAVRALLPHYDEQRTRRLWDDADEWLDLLDRLPLTLCHRDAFRNNLIARRGVGGQFETVAVDWALAGPGHLGEDLIKLVFNTCLFLRVDCPARDLDQLCFDVYLAGLRDVGWAGDRRLARLGYVANAAVYGSTAAVIPAILADPQRTAAMADAFGVTPEALATRFAEMLGYLLDLADEGRALLRLPDARAA